MIAAVEILLFVLLVFRWKWQALSPLFLIILYAFVSALIAESMNLKGILADILLTLVIDIPIIAVLMTCIILEPPKNAFGQTIIDKIKSKFGKN